MQDFNGYVPVAKLQELGKGLILWKCEKDGTSYEVLQIPYGKEYHVNRIWQNEIKPLINKEITGIQKIVDGGELENEDVFIVYEECVNGSSQKPLEIMKNIATGLNELKIENSEKFIISPDSIKNKLKFIGLFGLFKKLDLLDKKYLSPNVNKWLEDDKKTPPNFQDDIYSLVKSFENDLKEANHDDANEILKRGLAEERTDRFNKYSDIIDLLDNICRKKLKIVIKDAPTEEFLQILDEMNKHCELNIEHKKSEKEQITVRFYTNNWQGIFFVDDSYVFLPVQNCYRRREFKTGLNWFPADFSFSLHEKSNFPSLDYFTEKFENINQLASLNKTKKLTVDKWQTMPEKEKEFIEENAFCVEYKDVEFRKTNAVFSLTGDLNDKTWETMKKYKSEGTPLYAPTPYPPPEEIIKVGKIGEFHSTDKKLVIKDILCNEEDIMKKGKLEENIHQKISQFKKQMKACQCFLKQAVVNPVLCSILANPDTSGIWNDKKLDEEDREKFEKEVFNEKLLTDETQLEAVLEAISYKPLYLIQGPPGTGKTTVIVECIRQIIKRKPNAKILITSQSNLAVDNVLEKIAETNQNLKFMRLASESEDREMNVLDTIKPHTYEAKLKKWVKETVEKHEKYIASNFITQENNKILVEFYTAVQEISGTNEAEVYSKFKDKLNKQPNNYIKKLFENSKTMKNVKKTFESVLGEEYLKLKDIGREWTAFLSNTTNKNKELQSKLNNGSEEINFLTAMVIDMSIIGATCIHIASSKYKMDFKFDYVIMDESSKASPAETLVPINMGENIILIGDHKQLPPIVTREEAVKQKVKKELDDNGLDIEKEFGESLFEKLITAFEEDESKQKYIKMLNIQYRMPKQIGSLISKFFYDGKLKNPANEVIPDFDEKHGHGLKLKKDTSIVFLSTSKREKPYDNGNKYKRENECNMKYIKEILKKLDELYANNSQKKEPFTIGIIAGYRGQVELLRRNIDVRQYKNCIVEINTVDQFQGAERDIIIYDIVRSDSSASNIGFLDDDRRINVAFSRAKRLLIVVGDSEYIIEKATPNPGAEGIFKKFKLKEIAKYLKEEGLVFNSLEEVF